MKKLWDKTSGCTGEKPYSVTFDDLINNKIPDILNTRRNYKVIQKDMKNTYKDMLNNDGVERSIGTVIKSSMWCDNKESDANPCDNKYHGTGNVTELTREARELCRERVWRNSGCHLIDIGDGIVNLEWETKMNSIGGEVLEGIQKSIELTRREI